MRVGPGIFRPAKASSPFALHPGIVLRLAQNRPIHEIRSAGVGGVSPFPMQFRFGMLRKKGSNLLFVFPGVDGTRHVDKTPAPRG